MITLTSYGIREEFFLDLTRDKQEEILKKLSDEEVVRLRRMAFRNRERKRKEKIPVIKAIYFKNSICVGVEWWEKFQLICKKHRSVL